jgi:[calcium/calmodulin-dependent protein kinase] kinase
VHRDIKPQNILFDDKGKAKLADFGVASFVTNDNDTLFKMEGTYNFMAPELVSKNGLGSGYSGRAADIWALGITFYSFVYYETPFKGDPANAMELFDQIEKKP